jgi:hypothetical protein
MEIMAFVFESQAKLYCWQIAQNYSDIQLIIKNAVRLILDNFGIVGFLFFGRIPVDSSHFSLFYVERFKAQFNPSVYGPTGGRKKNVAY